MSPTASLTGHQSNVMLIRILRISWLLKKVRGLSLLVFLTRCQSLVLPVPESCTWVTSFLIVTFSLVFCRIRFQTIIKKPTWFILNSQCTTIFQELLELRTYRCLRRLWHRSTIRTWLWSWNVMLTLLQVSICTLCFLKSSITSTISQSMSYWKHLWFWVPLTRQY